MLLLPLLLPLPLPLPLPWPLQLPQLSQPVPPRPHIRFHHPVLGIPKVVPGEGVNTGVQLCDCDGVKREVAAQREGRAPPPEADHSGRGGAPLKPGLRFVAPPLVPVLSLSGSGEGTLLLLLLLLLLEVLMVGCDEGEEGGPQEGEASQHGSVVLRC